MSSRLVDLALHRCTLSGTAKLCFVALCSDSNDKGDPIHPGVDKLAKILNVSRSNASAALKTVSESGWASIEGYARGGHGMATTYRVNVERLTQNDLFNRPAIRSVSASEPKNQPAGRSVVQATDLPQSTDLLADNRPASGTILPAGHQKLEDKKKIKETTTREPWPELPDWISPSDWADFTAMRMEIAKPKRLPWTPRAARVAIGDLERKRSQGYDPGMLLQASAAAGWAGFFPKEADRIAPPAQGGLQLAPLTNGAAVAWEKLRVAARDGKQSDDPVVNSIIREWGGLQAIGSGTRQWALDSRRKEFEQRYYVGKAHG